MTTNLFQIIKDSDYNFEAVPTWLKNEEEPEFKFDLFGESGPNLVLLHGLLGAMTNWQESLPYFKEYARAYAFHFPLLTGNRNDVRIKPLAAYTDYFIRKQELKSPLILCGNSLGGHVALRLVLGSPGSVDALVLAGSSGLYEHTVDTLPVRPSRDFLVSQMQRVFYDEKFITEEAIEEVFGITNSKKHQLNIIHAARSAKKDYLLEQLKKIDIPVLLIWGENDMVTTMDVAKTFHANLPNSKLVTVPKCGHAPMIEHPKMFSNLVKDFLKENNLLK